MVEENQAKIPENVAAASPVAEAVDCPADPGGSPKSWDQQGVRSATPMQSLVKIIHFFPYMVLT
jgi:hypothetical protein